MLELLSYPPIIRGFVLLVISGFTFPIGGVFIIRMNLLPIRYLLMHGLLLGGALGLAMNINLTASVLVINLFLILILHLSSRAFSSDYGQMTMFFMVASVAAASVITSVFHVPAKDTLVLLWGSLYTSTTLSVITSAVIGGGIICFTVLMFSRLTALFYDKEVAVSLGVKAGALELVIMLIIAIVVASAMQLMGALLLDAQLILPVVIAGFIASGLRQTLVLSCVFGGVFSIVGFILSLLMDIPVSAGVAIPAVITLAAILLLRKRKNYEIIQ